MTTTQKFGSSPTAFKHTSQFKTYSLHWLKLLWSFLKQLVKDISLHCTHAHTAIYTHKIQCKLTSLLERSSTELVHSRIKLTTYTLNYVTTYVGPMSSPVISSSMMLLSSFFSSCLSRILRMVTLRGKGYGQRKCRARATSKCRIATTSLEWMPARGRGDFVSECPGREPHSCLTLDRPFLWAFPRIEPQQTVHLLQQHLQFVTLHVCWLCHRNNIHFLLSQLRCNTPYNAHQSYNLTCLHRSSPRIWPS